ncbi:hypothetical protein PH213_42205 [Streptomyces sp. SRF1]|uniref:hypothetical protein n=1 Tax=Streptomyces sp. SRF1 TaxID=1549642 RepID=UPI0025B05029|nr:hypothetical protein [Streptomyces sp. SRF1]MDN3061003.1 hypothetical protein [Streptomyces sp. SRF1]
MNSMPGIRQVRAVTQMVGRRTALRYLAVGMGASILAACGKNRDNSKDSGSTHGTSTGPVGQAVSAFVRGKWRVEVNPSRDESIDLIVMVTASSWTIEPYKRGAWEDSASWSGQWALVGNKLTLQGPTSPDNPDLVRRVAAFDVPGKIGDTGSLRLVWRVLNGGSLDADDELRVKYAKGTLHIVHIADVADDGFRTEFSCTRV